jgi:hypothetical protein
MRSMVEGRFALSKPLHRTASGPLPIAFGDREDWPQEL